MIFIKKHSCGQKNENVIPTKVGIQRKDKDIDSCFRRNDSLGYSQVKIFPLILLIVMVTCFGCTASQEEEYLRDLKSSNIVVKREAIYGIGKLKIKEAVPELLSLLDKDSGEATEEIIEALGRLGDSAAVEPLITKLYSDNALVREKAIEALGKIGDKRAVPAIVSILEKMDSKGEREVFIAIWALGNIGDISGEPILHSILNQSTNKYLHYNVEQALKKIRTIPVEPVKPTPAPEKSEKQQDNSLRESDKTFFHNIYKFLQSKIELVKEKLSWLKELVTQRNTRMINALEKSYNNIYLSGIINVDLPNFYKQLKNPDRVTSSASGQETEPNKTELPYPILAKTASLVVIATEEKSKPKLENTVTKSAPKLQNNIRQNKIVNTTPPSIPQQASIMGAVQSETKSVDASEPVVENKIYNFHELPLSVKQSLPAFIISFFIYSDDPASRMVRINDHMLQEGQYLTAGLKLEEITRDGIIFNNQTYRFVVRVK